MHCLNRSWRRLCGAALLLLVFSSGAAAQDQGWRTYLEEAQKALRIGDRQKAIENYRVLVNQFTNLRAFPEWGKEKEVLPLEIEADARIMLASLYASGPQQSLGSIQIQQAENEFRTAIEIVEQKKIPIADRVLVSPTLLVRAHNSLGVFLLRQHRVSEALKMLADVRKEAGALAATDKLAFSRYLYNLGRALSEMGSQDQSIQNLVQAYDADPSFSPAVKAALEAAWSAPPSNGLLAVQSLVKTALRAGDTLQAEEILRSAIARTDWYRDDGFLSLIDLLARYFADVSLTATVFRDSWETTLKEASNASPKVADKLELIFQIFTGTVAFCGAPQQAFKIYAEWADTASEREIISRLLKITADDRFLQQDEDGAAKRYRLAICFDRTNDAATYFANLLDYSPTQKAQFDREAAATHEWILAAVATGFARIGNPYKAAEVFMDIASTMAERRDVVNARAYLDLANGQQLSQEQLASLSERGEKILRKAVEFPGEITVQAGIAGRPSIILTAYHQTPIRPQPWQAASGIVPDILPEKTTYAAVESGQRETFVLSGSTPSGGQYSVDGVAVGELSESPGPPAYYALDAIEEIEVALSGVDLNWPTLSGGINLVTKWPEDKWIVSVAQTAMSEKLQEASGIPIGQVRTGTNRIERSNETTVEIGGPVYKQRFLGWLFYSDTRSATRALGGGLDDVGLTTAIMKILGRVGESDLLRLSFSRGSRSEDGAGASILRAPETTWKHSGDSDFFKLEYDYDSDNWELRSHYAHSSNDFSFLPRQRAADVFLSADGIWRDSYSSLSSRSSVSQWEATASRDFGTHKLEFGARLRDLDLLTNSSVGINNATILARENLGSDFDAIRLYRSGTTEAQLGQRAVWIQDSRQFDQLTLSFGLRYDYQSGENTRARALSNPLLSELVPGINSGHSGRIHWEMVSPRIGLSFPLVPEYLLVQANYSRFGSELTARHLYHTNPVFQAYAQLGFNDANSNGRLDRGELSSLFSLAPSGFDPAAPDESPNRNAPDLHPEVTDEIALELRTPPSRKFQVGLVATVRRISQILELRSLVRDEFDAIRVAQRNDYRLERVERMILPDGTVRTAPVFALRSGLSFTGGSLLVNGDREQTFLGLRLAFAGAFVGAQLRGYLSYDDWRWKVGSEFRRFDDPTNLVQSPDASGVSRADDDGDVVAPKAFRDENDAPLLNSRWTLHLSGSRLLPFFGLSAGASLNVREGFPLAHYITVIPSDGQIREVQVESHTDSSRLGNLILLDFRLEKTIDWAPIQAIFSLDCFNVFNRSTALWRVRQLNSPQADFLTRTLNPLGLRLGVRLGFLP